MELHNRVAVVTGGASGLGAAAVRALVRAGARVAVLDLQTSDSYDTSAAEGQLLRLKVDVSDEHDLDRAFESIVGTFGAVHVAVNCAGVGTGATVLRDGVAEPLESFRRTMAVNLIGLFDVVRRCAELMVCNEPSEDRERGVIINVASVAAWQGQRGQAAYAASKAGVLGLTLPVARELAAHGIRVVGIAPGLFRTGMYDSLPEKVTRRMRESALYPERAGNPDEFAALVEHVLANRYINATTLQLDAGIRLM